MRKSTSLCFLIALAASQCLAAPVTVPTALRLGDQYRLAFVTSTTTAATSSDINYYNNFVASDANSVSQLAGLGTTWAVIGSTPTVAAEDNTNTNPCVSSGFPIYNLAGNLVVPNNLALWVYGDSSGAFSHPIDVTESGNRLSTGVWTGTDFNGLADPFSLGGTFPGYPDTDYGLTDFPGGPGNGGWTSDYYANSTMLLPMYAISGVLTVRTATAGGGLTSVGGVNADFGNANVTTPGTLTSNFQEATSAAALTAAIGTVAAGQINFLLSGSMIQVWDLSFSGVFTGDATTTLHFDPSLINVPVADLVIEHYENGQWAIPSGQVVDPVADTITFQTDSFSPFVLSEVPEPSTFALLIAGAIGLVVAGRRKPRR